MPRLSKGSIRFAFFDLPYNCTQSHWDTPIDLNQLWRHWKILAQDKWTIAATATFRFAVRLFLSAPKLFRYDLVFNKLLCSGFLQAKHAPMRYHENILVFGRDRGIYHPQREKRKPGFRGVHNQCGGRHETWQLTNKPKQYLFSDTILPRSILPVMGEAKCLLKHSAQKPVALLSWLISTYTNPGDTVLDPASGHNSTAIAALRLNRNCICIEQDSQVFKKGVERVEKELATLTSSCDLKVAA